MFEMHSLAHFERCRVARCMAARLIDARLTGTEAEAAYMSLSEEATADSAQRAMLLVQQSALVH